jgi:hypothetical protein
VCRETTVNRRSPPAAGFSRISGLFPGLDGRRRAPHIYFGDATGIAGIA